MCIRPFLPGYAAIELIILYLFLANVSHALSGKKAESIALILTCSGLSIQLCGKEEKVSLKYHYC